MSDRESVCAHLRLVVKCENHDVYNIFMSYSRIYQIKAGRWSHLEMINNPAVETRCRVYQRYKQTLSEC